MKKKLASKVIAGALASAMVLSMAACGNNDEGSSSGSGSSTPTSSSNTPSSSNTGSTAGGDASQADNSTPETLAPMKITVSINGDNPYAEEATDPTYLKLVQAINEYTNMDVTYEIIVDSAHSGGQVLRFASQDVADVTKIWTSADFWSACVGGGTYTVAEPVLDADGNVVMEDVVDENGNPVKDDDGNVKQQEKTVEKEVAISDGLFWDLTDYIDDYDNLATIPAAVRSAASYNGRMYFLPLSRTLARNGMGYRKDWAEKLNLSFHNKIEAGEDPTWQDFYDMLYAFTYNDPDGNGVNDTCGMLLDQWIGKDFFNNIAVWFGAPNEWGIDENGDLVYKFMTDEYMAMLDAMRQLYEDGLINDGSQSGVDPWWTLGPGKNRNNIQSNQGGACVQTLDFMRKIETTFETNGEGGATADNPIWWLNGYIIANDAGERYCYPTDGFQNGVAITKKNIKTEDEMKRVLQFLNDINDGEIKNVINNGWEGVTYDLDENGYINLWLPNDEVNGPKLAAAGVDSEKYRFGFEQMICGFTAPENPAPAERAPATGAIQLRENALYEDDIPYCVPNYGISYRCKTYVNDGAALDAILYGTDPTVEGERGCQLAYVMGEIDKAGLEAAIQQWWNAGGEQWTKEMNDAYHAAGN